VSDIRSCLSDTDPAHLPWAYEDEASTNPSSSSDESQTGPDVERQDQPGTAGETEGRDSHSREEDMNDHHFKRLEATWESLKLRYERHKQQSESRRHQQKRENQDKERLEDGFWRVHHELARAKIFRAERAGPKLHLDICRQ
jgi:hypothetical protein